MMYFLFFAQWVFAAPVTAPWTSVLDPQLEQLLNVMAENNGDLVSSEQRERVLASVKQAQVGALLPTLSINASSQIAPYNSVGFTFGGFPTIPGVVPPKIYRNGSLMANFAWTIDWTGRQWVQSRAAQMDTLAASGDLDGLRLTLSAVVAGTYFDWVASSQTRLIVVHQLEEAESLLQSIELRYGSDSGALEVLQQRQSIAAIRAAVPRAESAQAIAFEQLYGLVGEHPTLTAGDLPEVNALIKGEVRVDELPGVRAAEARQRAASYRQKAAARAALPTLQATAQAGRQFSKFSESKSLDTWGGGLVLRVPLFAGGQAYQGYRQAGLSQMGAASQLEQARRDAEVSVRNAETQERSLRQQLRAFEEQEVSARAAYGLAREQYLSGGVGFLTVQSASNAWQIAQLNQLNAARALVGARVQYIVASAGTLDFGAPYDHH